MPAGRSLYFAACAAFFVLASSAAAGLTPQEVNVVGSAGRSITNWHGASRFTSGRIELLAKPSFLEQHVSNSQFVAAFTYSRVRQPRSWFGYTYGDPDDNLRAFAFYAGVRKNWRTEARVGTYAEIGTGPVWSNRRLPAATSQVNFESQLGAGVIFRAMRTPIYLGYRFSHISNGGVVKRNPGLQVNAFVIGLRVKRLAE